MAGLLTFGSQTCRRPSPRCDSWPDEPALSETAATGRGGGSAPAQGGQVKEVRGQESRRGKQSSCSVISTLLTSCLMVSFGKALMADSSVSSQALLTTVETTHQFPAFSQSTASTRPIVIKHPKHTFNVQPIQSRTKSISIHPASSQSTSSCQPITSSIILAIIYPISIQHASGIQNPTNQYPASEQSISKSSQSASSVHPICIK